MLDVNLKQSIISNTFFNISHRFLNIFLRALLAPFIIFKIGLGGFGVWNVLVSLTNYGRFGIGGIDAAFQKYVSEATASGNYKKASHLLTTGSLAVFVLSSLVSIPFLIFTDLIVSFLNIPEDFSVTFSASLRFLMIVIVISNSTIAYNSIIAGAHRLALTRKIAIIWLILESFLIVLLLLNGYRLFALTLPFAVSELGRTFSCIFFARKILPEVSIHPRFLSTEILRDLAGYAGTFHVVGTLEMLYSTVVTMLVMRYFGASISGLFAAATRLISVASLTAGSLMLPLLSASTYAVTKGNEKIDRTVFLYSLKFVLLTTIPLMLYMAFYSDYLLYAWTGEEHELFMKIMFLLASNGMCNIFARHHMIIYRARGEKIYDVIWLVIRFAGFLTLGLIFSQYLGLIGLLLGQLFGEVFGFLVMIYAVQKYFDSSLFGVVRESYLQISVFVVLIGVLWYLSITAIAWPIGRIFALVVVVVSFAVYFSISGVIIWTGLSRAEKDGVRSTNAYQQIAKILRR